MVARAPFAAAAAHTVRLALLLSLAMAVFLVQRQDPPLAQWASEFWMAWCESILTKTPMLACVVFGHQALGALARWRWAALLALAVLSGALGWLALSIVLGINAVDLDNPYLPVNLQFHLLLGAGLVALCELRERSRQTEEALHDEQLRQLTIGRELVLAQLQVLHAQVEPHFLFNSLANLRRLLRVDPPLARGMLADLLRYLEETLPRLREECSTLGREMVLVRAFLSLHQVRMGARLQVAYDIPAVLLAHEVPPMVLLTLVENALKHGVQPLPAGGAIEISARASAHVLKLTVSDTGRGLGSACGQGTGLANLRARLQALYGTAASLSLGMNTPHGLVATISLPGILPEAVLVV